MDNKFFTVLLLGIFVVGYITIKGLKENPQPVEKYEKQKNVNSIEEKLSLENEVYQLQQIYNRLYHGRDRTFSAHVKQMRLEKQIRALMDKYKEKYGETEWAKFYNKQKQIFR